MYFLVWRKKLAIVANVVLVLDGQLWGHKMNFCEHKDNLIYTES